MQQYYYTTLVFKKCPIIYKNQIEVIRASTPLSTPSFSSQYAQAFVKQMLGGRYCEGKVCSRPCNLNIHFRKKTPGLTIFLEITEVRKIPIYKITVILSDYDTAVKAYIHMQILTYQGSINGILSHLQDYEHFFITYYSPIAFCASSTATLFFFLRVHQSF